MSKKLVIKNGIIDNIIKADDSFTLDGAIIVDFQEGAEIGYAWDGKSVVTPEPETVDLEALANKVREERNTLLAETDWWASSDLTMTAEQTAYRQALRDVPSQEGFPENVIWPEKP